MVDLRPEQIYAAVRALLDQMSPEMRAEAEALLRRAEAGEKVDLALLRLVRRDERLRERLNALLFPEEGARGFEPLPGPPSASPSAPRYVCPQPDCGYTWRPPQAGAPRPRCPEHGLELIPAPAGGGDDA